NTRQANTGAALKSSELGISAGLMAQRLHNSLGQNSAGVLNNIHGSMQSAPSGISADAAAKPHLKSFGVKVLAPPSIDNVYVGSYWNTTQGKADTSHQDAAAKAWVTSSNEALLSQYGVGKAKFAGSEKINVTNPKTFTDSSAQKLIKQQIA